MFNNTTQYQSYKFLSDEKKHKIFNSIEKNLGNIKDLMLENISLDNGSKSEFRNTILNKLKLLPDYHIIKNIFTNNDLNKSQTIDQFFVFLISIQETEIKPDKTKNMCLICKSNPCEFVVIPCGHKCLCLDCKSSLISNQITECPICRSNFWNIFKVYE